MKALLRKLRSMIGLGAVWAVAWTPLTVLVGTIEVLLAGRGLPPLDQVLGYAVTGARSGFIAGVFFGAGLSLIYRSRLIGDLRPWGVGILGGSAGIILGAATLLPRVFWGTLPPVTVAFVVGYCGVFGALAATGAVKLAQADLNQIESRDGVDATPLLNP